MDDAEWDAEIDRRVRRYHAEQAEVDKLKEQEARAKSASDYRAMDAAANAGLTLARMRSAAQTPRFKKKYEGPDPDRQIIDGKPVVSREELADFQRKNPGATLRDLLNADRGLTRRGTPAPASAPAPVPSAQDMQARGRAPVMRVTPPPPPPSPFSPQAERAAKAVAAERKRVEDFDAQLAARRQEEARQERLMRPGSQAIEPVYPEMLVVGPGAAGIRSLATQARSLLSRAAPERAAASTAAEATGPVWDIPNVFRNAGDKARAAAAAEEAQAANVFRNAGQRMRDEDLARSFRELTTGLDDVVPPFRRGGKVSSKISSKPKVTKPKASRGDGIAQRGKTKGRYL